MTHHQTRYSIFCWLIAISMATAGLAACGGGGGGGSGGGAPVFSGIQEPAEVDEDNVEEVGSTVSEAAAYMVDVETSGDTLPLAVVASGNPSPRLGQVIHDLGMRLFAMPRADNADNTVSGAVQRITLTSAQLNQELDEPLFCGGSVRMVYNDADILSGKIEITYNNLCMLLPDFLSEVPTNAQYKFNGSYTMNFTETSNSIKSTLRITYPDGSIHTMFYTMECDGDFFNCEFSSDYVGNDGKTYRVSNVVVGGNESSGYNVSATFYHPDFGYLEIAANDIKFECAGILPGWQPSTGVLTFTAKNGTGTVTFDNCEEYSWSFDNGGGVISGNVSWSNE